MKFNRLTLYHKGRHVSHVPPPANLFQNASNFFKQRLAFGIAPDRQYRWPDRLNGGGLYAGLSDLSTPKMNVFHFFYARTVFSYFSRDLCASEKRSSPQLCWSFALAIM